MTNESRKALTQIKRKISKAIQIQIGACGDESEIGRSVRLELEAYNLIEDEFDRLQALAIPNLNR